MTQGIQCSIGGFSGAPVTLFAAHDNDTGIVTVASVNALRRERYKDCVVITNIVGIESDERFDESRLRDAIDAWNALRHDRLADGSARLLYSEQARRANPATVIEADGMSERGRQYRLAESAGNETVATLVACLWAYRADTRANVLDVADSMANRLLRGEAVTVGTNKIPPWELNPVYVHGYQVDQQVAGAYWDKRDR